MRGRMLICPILVGLMLSGCIYVKTSGRPCPSLDERMEALEQQERELDEQAAALERWERALNEREEELEE